MEKSKIKLPNRDQYTQKEVARITKLNTSVLEFWEDEFKGILSSGRRENVQSYLKEDIEKILKIKQLFVIERRNKDDVKKILTKEHQEDLRKRIPERKEDNITMIKDGGIVKEQKIIEISKKIEESKFIKQAKISKINKNKITLIKEGLVELLTMFDKNDKNKS